MIESLKNYFTSLNAAERENFAKSVNMNVAAYWAYLPR